LIARAIHNSSPRRQKTFVKLNCSAIPSGLLESELFGHEKGAFTGAIAQKIGRMELADRGTCFSMKSVIFLSSYNRSCCVHFRSANSNGWAPIVRFKADIRLIAATHRNLSEMVASREFRSDLYYRSECLPRQAAAAARSG
jgi:formate hydrogenlyase transcriptional activator